MDKSSGSERTEWWLDAFIPTAFAAIALLACQMWHRTGSIVGYFALMGLTAYLWWRAWRHWRGH